MQMKSDTIYPVPRPKKTVFEILLLLLLLLLHLLSALPFQTEIPFPPYLNATHTASKSLYSYISPLSNPALPTFLLYFAMGNLFMVLAEKFNQKSRGNVQSEYIGKQAQ